MIWSIIQVVGKQGTSLLIFAVLALLLNPKDFGILGIAMTWIAFIQVFSELGFGAALIQRQNVNSEHFSSIFFINVGIGLLLTIIGIVLSWPCAIFFKTLEVQPVMAVLSFGFIVNSFSLTQLAIAQKELRFKNLAIRDISAALIGGIIGIIFALLKFGVWSLVIQSLTTYTIGTILLWNISEWRPHIKEFSLQCIRELWDYSSKIFAFQIFKYFAQNIDKLIIGYFLGSIALGIYTFAYKLVIYPISTVVGAIGGYLFPGYSRIQEDLPAITKSYLFIVKSINSVVLPVMVLIAFLSPIFVPYIWGQKWVQAIPLIQIFAVLAVVASFISPVGQLMKALNRPGWLFNWSVFITLVATVLIYLGAIKGGILGSAIGLTIAYILGLPANLFIIVKLLHTNLRSILKPLFPSVVATLLLGLFLWSFLRFNIALADFRGIIGLALSVTFYLLTLTLFDKTFLVTIFKKLSKA